MPAAPGTRSSAFLRSQSSRAASMSSPTCVERRSMSSTSRSGSSIPRGLPVALGLLTLGELLVQVLVLVGAPLMRAHLRRQIGLLGRPPFLALARRLLDPQFLGIRFAHATILRPGVDDRLLLVQGVVPEREAVAKAELVDQAWVRASTASAAAPALWPR